MEALKIVGAILVLLIGIGVILYVLLRKSPVKPEEPEEETDAEGEDAEDGDGTEEEPATDAKNVDNK